MEMDMKMEMEMEMAMGMEMDVGMEMATVIKYLDELDHCGVDSNLFTGEILAGCTSVFAQRLEMVMVMGCALQLQNQ